MPSEPEPIMPRPPILSTFSLDDLAQRLDATLVAPDPSLRISGVAGIEFAGPQHLTFIANPKYSAQVHSTRAGAILVEPGFAETPVPTLRVTNPYLAFARAVELFYRAPVYPPGVHHTAVVAEGARIGARAHIGAYVVIMEGAIVGDDAVILPHVVLYPHVTAGNHLFAHAHAVVREGCHLGDHVTLQNGAVIGADGFGFAKRPEDGAGKLWHKIVQSGPAVLENSVEVQANACVDRASVGETRIGAGTKIDNLVQVGHGSTVGKDTLLCAQAGLAGSTRIGNRVILAGQVGVAGHCTVGDDVIATAQSGIPGDVVAGKIVSGYPAVENRQWLRSVALLNRLPHFMRNLKAASVVTTKE